MAAHETPNGPPPPGALPPDGRGVLTGDQPDLTDSQLNAFAVDRLSQAFETSAKRWELIVYPSLFAFIILAAYGFYLVDRKSVV